MKNPSRHHRFRQKMAEANFQQIARCKGPDTTFESELHFWQGTNGKLFITQEWDGETGTDGGYEVYYPTEYHGLDECEREAIRYGTEPETPARELYAALQGVMGDKYAHSMLQKHLGLTSQKP